MNRAARMAAPALPAALVVAAIMLAVRHGDQAGPRDYGDVAVSEVVSIYDGDTITVNIRDWPPVVGDRIPVRLLHVDTPELRDSRPETRELARRARNYVESRLSVAARIELRGIRRDKYFRLLAEVYVDGVSLSTELLEKGLARPYEGGAKDEW